MPAGVLTEHRVTHPEITVDGDEAEATWYLQDHVIVPIRLHAHGCGVLPRPLPQDAGRLEECATGYDRTYEATMSLKALNFKATPGAAIATTT